jgi:hypothetical protein
MLALEKLTHSATEGSPLGLSISEFFKPHQQHLVHPRRSSSRARLHYWIQQFVWLGSTLPETRAD